LDRTTILEWLNQLGYEYTVLEDLPPSYEYGVVIKKSTVIVFWHKNDDVIELQSTPTFNDSITKSFFDMNDASRENVSCKLREKLLGLNIRHNIVALKKEHLFGFTLKIYLPKTLSKIDLLNAHDRITEIRDVMGQYIAPIIAEETTL